MNEPAQVPMDSVRDHVVNAFRTAWHVYHGCGTPSAKGLISSLRS